MYLILQIVHFLGRIFEADQDRVQRENEAYLADAVDLYDLEQRMRRLDRRPVAVPYHLHG